MATPAPYGHPAANPSQPDADYTSDDHGPYKSEAQRKLAMKRAYKAYKGKLPRPLKPDKGSGLNHSLRENRLRPIVNMGVAFLFGKPVSFAVEEAAPAEAQDWLDTVLAANQQETLFQAYAQNGGIFGHAYLKVIPNGLIWKGEVYPRLMVLDPMQVSVETAEGDLQCVTAYNIEFQGKDPLGTPCDRRQRIERELPEGMDNDDVPLGSPDVKWRICEQYRKVAQGMSLVPTDPNAGWEYMPGDNEGKAISYWCGNDNTPLCWPPIFDNQNLIEANCYYGVPDLDDDLIELNVGINRAISDANKIIHFWGTPKLWTAGGEPQNIQVSADDVTVIPDPEGALHVLEMAGDLSAIREHIKHLMETMDELSSVPGVALGRMENLPSGDVPGITMKLWFESLLVKTDVKRGTYGNMGEQLGSRLLELGGHGEGWDVALHWGNPLPVNMTEMAAIAQEILQQQLASKDWVQRQLGIDPEEENLKMKAEQEEAAKNAPPMPSMPPIADQVNQLLQSSPDWQQGKNLGAASPYPPQGNPATLNHPAMQAQRAAAIATAAGGN